MSFLELCPPEVLQLVFNALPDPSALICTSRHLYAFSQDPYVRAHYFLSRYGNIQALYFALARGKLLSPRVFDILLASGAIISRYLVQVAFHHFFHSQSHFLKPSLPWVRNVSLDTFSYFLKLAADKYGDIPRGKNEDDGSLFATFIKESKFPAESQQVSWEVIRDIFEKYHFIPFCNRDPLMAQFPLALAREPRLLPYAEANGFYMDSKYRNFVFRKMFERTQAPALVHAEEIVTNVRELCRLDSNMFVTRTVAAEVCLEANTNEAGYRALKQLDRTGDLAFSLADLVRDVIKLFVKARAITTSATSQILTQLYTDFWAPPPVPAAFTSSSRTALTSSRITSMDPTVRRAMLLTVFAAEPPIAASAMAARLAPLRLGPLTLRDAADVLLSAFVEKHSPVMEYFKREGVSDGVGGTRKVTTAELRALAEDVAARCLVQEGKGKTLKRLCEGYPAAKARIARTVLNEYQIDLQDDMCDGDWRPYAPLAHFMGGTVLYESEDEGNDSEPGLEDEDDEMQDTESVDGYTEHMNNSTADAETNKLELGGISLEPLSTMIRRDEMQGGRGRRRYYPMMFGTSSINSSRLPQDAQSVSKWIKAEYGALSGVTATFLTHAIINGNNSILSHYLLAVPATEVVPITLKHFQILARLGSASAEFYLYERIKQGAPFYLTEKDYLTDADAVKFKLNKGKGKEIQPASPTHVKTESVKTELAESVAAPSPPRGKKRPRRSAATSISYAVPDSDDEAIAAEEDLNDEFAEFRLGAINNNKRKTPKVEKVETPLQSWIKALGELLKEEQRKYREKKKLVEKAAGSGEKTRVTKNDFFRSLTTNLRSLREYEAEQRMFRVASGAEVPDSDGEDDEYVQQKTHRNKKRRTTTA